MDLSVIIVNYNVKYFLEHCLLSVQKACREMDAEIFVVDNNSTDGSRSYLEPKFPSVHFIWHNENIGFAKANNLALKHAAGNFTLFLNPDTIVPEDCFTACMDFFHSHDDCGALGVRMIDGSGRFLKESKRSLPGLRSGFYKSIGLANAFPKSKVFSKYYAAHLPEKESRKTEVLAGAFMMLGRKAIEVTRGFDEDFFMYGEDVDLSYRITKAGFHNYYFAETTIIHFKGESTQRRSKAFIKNFYGAMRLFIKKHYKENVVKSFLLQAGVSVSKVLAGLKPAGPAPGAVTEKKKTIIFGSANEKERVKQLMKSAPQFKISIDPVSGDFIGKNGDAVVFCEGQLSNKAIIEMIEKIPEGCLALFYASGAESIIGSSDRNTNGLFISAS